MGRRRASWLREREPGRRAAGEVDGVRSPSALRGQGAPSSALAALGRAVCIEAGYLPCGIKHVETERREEDSVCGSAVFAVTVSASRYVRTESSLLF